MDVCVSLRSVQKMDGDVETAEMTARGTLELSADGARLCYTESPQDGGAAVTVTVRNAQIMIERRGEFSSNLLLEEGERHACRFDTPYGQMLLHTQAKHVSFSFAEHVGTLRAVYMLDMNGAYTEQDIKIGIKEVSQC